MKSGKKALSIVLLLIALVLANYLASSWGARVDFTGDRIYTLSDGTRNLLKKVEEPITLRFFFNRSLENIPVFFKNYATRVEEMLRQYVVASGGKVRLVVVDPKPDSKEEDAANRSGVTGQALGDGRSLFFGVVAQQADQEKAIAFFTPQRESFLEYDISQLLYTVQQVSKPKLGLLSSLPLRGAGYTVPGMPRQQEGQVVAEEWARTYDIVEVQPSATELPADIDALAIVHPQKLPEKLLFAIDQFVLSGKPAFIALDPSSQYFRRQGQQMGMYGGTQSNVASDLPRLLAAWGVKFDPQIVVGDPELASTVQTQQGPTSMPTWLTLRAASFNRQFVPLSAVHAMVFVESGSLTVTKTDGLDATPIVETSQRSGTLNAMFLQFGQGADLTKQIAPAGHKQTLAVFLRGSFKTAFPDGEPKDAKPVEEKKPGDTAVPKPGTPAAGETTPKDTVAENSKPEPQNAKPASLTASAKPGSVFLVADTDWLLDAYSVRRIPFLGVDAVQPLNDNLAFGTNVLDFLGGSNDLISIRGKGTALRPFEVFRKMELAAQARYQEQLDALEVRLSDVQKRLSDLLQGQKDKSVLVATPAMQDEIDKFRAEESTMRAERRSIRRALREDIEKLQNILILLNLLAVPALVAIGGMWFFERRNKRQSAM